MQRFDKSKSQAKFVTTTKLLLIKFFFHLVAEAAVETKKKSELRGGVKSPSPQSVTPTISYTTCNGTNSYNQNGPSAGNQTPNYDHCRVFSTSKNNELCHQIDLLQLIRQKFSLHSPTKTILTPDIDFCHISQHCDVNALVRELVAHCIISVRTAWLIRRCTKATERFREYLQMLTSLKLNDMTDLMNWCHKNRAFLDEFIFATMPKRGIEVRPKLICINHGFNLVIGQAIKKIYSHFERLVWKNILCFYACTLLGNYFSSGLWNSFRFEAELHTAEKVCPPSVFVFNTKVEHKKNPAFGSLLNERKMLGVQNIFATFKTRMQ